MTAPAKDFNDYWPPCERPILFSGPMVRGILDDRKTKTRRVVKADYGLDVETIALEARKSQVACDCPYGQPGDRLWVRETWQTLSLDYDYESGHCDGWEEADPEAVRRWKQSEQGDWGKPPYCVTYAADGGWDAHKGDRGFNWRPSIFMPRWASRLTLEITEVRVERLQSISESDAVAEGVLCPDCGDNNWREVGGEAVQCPHPHCGDGQALFRELWDDLNGKRGYGWDANPWVWVIGFRRIVVALRPSAGESDG